MMQVLHTRSSPLRRLLVAAAVLGCLGLAAGLTTMSVAAAPKRQATDTDTPTPTNTPTNTPSPTATDTPTATVTPGGYARPVIVLQSYSVPGGAVSPGQNFDLTFRLANPGQGTAFNVLASFEAGDFLPRGTGGGDGGFLSPEQAAVNRETDKSRANQARRPDLKPL